MKKCSDEEFLESPLRGVTSVLNAVFGNKFENSNIPEHVLQAAADRGTAVHKYIEDWLDWYGFTDRLGTEEPHLGLEYSIYETNFKEWLDDDRVFRLINPILIEHKLMNDKLGMKGIIDCVALVNGKTCMIDWKTSSNLDEWSVNCQLQLYYLLLSKGNKEERAIAKTIDELRCLSLTKSGYRWFKFDIDTELGKAILKLWNTHFREIAEKEKAKEKERKGTIVL